MQWHMSLDDAELHDAVKQYICHIASDHDLETKKAIAVDQKSQVMKLQAWGGLKLQTMPRVNSTLPECPLTQSKPKHITRLLL